MARAEVVWQPVKGDKKRMSGFVSVHNETIFVDGTKIKKCKKGDRFLQKGDCEANPQPHKIAD